MVKCPGPQRVQVSTKGHLQTSSNDEVTDDPLATIDPKRKGQKIYSVSRINPLYDANLLDSAKELKKQEETSRHGYPLEGEKSTSSGYGGSNGGSCNHPVYNEKVLVEDVTSVLGRTSTFVKTAQVSAPGRGKNPSSGSSTSGIGITLGTIVEGRTDTPIPRPIWPRQLRTNRDSYDSLVDEALLFYTSPTCPTLEHQQPEKEMYLKDFLVELSNCISATIEGKNGMAPEQMLRALKERITASLDALKHSTDEEMRRLCVNLSNRRVVRAFSHSSSSGNSSQSSPEFSCSRARTYSSEEDPYHLPSATSSSAFSDSVNGKGGVDGEESQNAIIYAAMYRANLRASDHQGGGSKGSRESVEGGGEGAAKKGLLEAANDGKPSVWQQYYGVNLAKRGTPTYSVKPTDIPLYPGGRPEADFTLDMPRSEMLSKRMKEDKKWRCRCRVLTSFLGLVFFLLSVMAVSLMLTRGKRMFGSMV